MPRSEQFWNKFNRNMVKTFKLNNLDATLELARQLVLKLTDDNYALLLYGGMGAGKTTFIRELGATLGIQEKITSPTFIGLNEYHLNNLNFYHFDLYQVLTSFEGLSEIISISDKKIILAIEWAEKLNSMQLVLLEKNLKVLTLEFSVIDDEAREINISESFSYRC